MCLCICLCVCLSDDIRFLCGQTDTDRYRDTYNTIQTRRQTDTHTHRAPFYVVRQADAHIHYNTDTRTHMHREHHFMRSDRQTHTDKHIHRGHHFMQLDRCTDTHTGHHFMWSDRHPHTHRHTLTLQYTQIHTDRGHHFMWSDRHRHTNTDTFNTIHTDIYIHTHRTQFHVVRHTGRCGQKHTYNTDRQTHTLTLQYRQIHTHRGHHFMWSDRHTHRQTHTDRHTYITKQYIHTQDTILCGQIDTHTYTLQYNTDRHTHMTPGEGSVFFIYLSLFKLVFPWWLEGL